MPRLFSKFSYALLIVLAFALPELWLWKSVDSFSEPFRYYRGDMAHYAVILDRAIEAGGPVGNSFFFEEQEHPSRFFVFELVAGLFGKLFAPAGVAVLVIALRIIVPVLSFLLFAELIRRVGISAEYANFLAALQILLYGVISFQGYGLANWYIPSLLAGLILVVEAFCDEQFSPRRAALLVVSIGLFTLHPAYFAFGGAVTGVAWFLWMRRFGVRAVGPFFVAWLGLAGVLFAMFFAGGLSSGAAATDFLARMALISTRFPIHPIVLLELGLAAIIAGYAARGAGEASARALHFLAVAFGIGFLAILAPSITGTYLVNDHYTIAHEYLVVVLAASLIFTGDVKTPKWSARFLVFAVVLDILFVLAYLNFKPGYYGRFATHHAAYFLIAGMVLWPGLRILLKKALAVTALRGLLVVAALGYALLLQYKDISGGHFAGHQAVQKYRPLIAELRKLPAGVVLADNTLSHIVPITTEHQIYWSSIAFSQTSTDEALLRRYQDAHLAFPDDPSHVPPGVINSLHGAVDRCREYGRGKVLEALSSRGWTAPLREICAPDRVRAEAYEISKERVQAFVSNANRTKSWQPEYRVDYLLVSDGATTTPVWILNTYFKKIGSAGGVSFYEFLGAK